MKITRPMLAATADTLKDIPLPCFISDKIDGIRAVVTSKGLVSRKLEPIPNSNIRRVFSKRELIGLDGELIIYDNDKERYLKFNETSSIVMSDSEIPDGHSCHYVVFDYVDPKIKVSQPYHSRYHALQRLADNESHSFYDDIYFWVLHQQPVINTEQLILYFNDLQSQRYFSNFEGVITRGYDSTYKFGRSTLKEGCLVKYKEFNSSEAEIVDFVEYKKNKAKPTKDKLGYSKKTKRKSDLKPAGILGQFIVKDPKYDTTFGVGTGFTMEQRADFWRKRKSLKGLIITYKFQKCGTLNVPRFPVFVGFRDRRDM